VSLLPAACARYFFLAGYGTSQSLIRTGHPYSQGFGCMVKPLQETPALVFFNPRNLSVWYR